jgi:hypothetical protein
LRNFSLYTAKIVFFGHTAFCGIKKNVQNNFKTCCLLTS